MRISNLNYKKEYGDRGIFNHGFWLHIKNHTFHSQIVVGKGVYNIGFKVGIGGLHSETPIDVAFYLPGLSVYLSTTMFRKLCDKISRASKNHYTSREFCLVLDGWTLRFEPWSKKNSWNSSDPKWVRGWDFNLNLPDRLLGSKRYFYFDLAKTDGLVRLPEANYPVTLTLQRQTLKRPKSKRAKIAYCVEWVGDIPFRNNSWKGNNILLSAVKVTEASINNRYSWIHEAEANIACKIQQDRTRYHYVQE